MSETCLLCNGTGQITLLTRQDKHGKYVSVTEINDVWLAELKAYCTQEKKAIVPPAYVVKLIDEIWQVTYLALQQASEIVELKRKLDGK